MSKVLIVDDHSIMRRGLHSVLEAYPEWDVCGEADSGESAIQAASELEPDVIIMDVSMPGIGGLEATRRIHKAQPAAKIVLLTFHKSTELIRAGFSAGATGYVLKEGAEDELIQALQAITQDKIYVSPAISPAVVASIFRLLEAQNPDEVSAKRNPAATS